MPDLYFEDFFEGQSMTFGDYAVTRQEIVDFATQFDPQSFHLDDEAARQTPLGGLAASGWHTSAMGMRMICDGFLDRSASLGAPGIDEVRWLKPVRPGDRLSITSRVTATRRSRSRPDRGIVTFAFGMYNQAGDCVMTQANSVMLGCRDVGAPA